MGLFNRKPPIDVNKPVTNQGLKSAISLFSQNQTEANLKLIVNAIIKANFLVLMYNDELIKTNNNDKTVTIEKGSILKFLNTFDMDKNKYLPILTDWTEVDIWLKTREGVTGWIMTAKEIFDFVSMQPGYKGIVINPASDRWAMDKQQIELFIRENY